MQKYRLTIQHHGRLLGHFESDVPWAREAVRSIAGCLGELGYDLELQVAEGERRLLESTPEGVRLLGSEPLFRRTSLHDL